MTMDKFPARIYLDSQALGEQDQTRISQSSLMATGRAYQDRVELNVKLSVVVRSDGWWSVPLRFGQAALLAACRATAFLAASLITVSEQTGQSQRRETREITRTLWLREPGKRPPRRST